MLARQAAAAVSVGTHWPCEPTATLRSALCRRGRLSDVRRFGAYRGRRGAGHIMAAAHLQLGLMLVYILLLCAFGVDSITDVNESCALSILGSLLVDGEKSPFYHSLLESGIGSDYAPTTG